MAGLLRPAVHRIACAIVSAEVRRLRDVDRPAAQPGDWPETMPIGDDGLGLDSLERLGALGALAETFQLDDGLLGAEPPDTVGDWIDWILRGQGAADSRLTVRTSGSTGEPRPCEHAVADLLHEAAFLATRFADRRRIIALVPAHHLYGLIWTALLPSVLGVPVVVRTAGTALGLIAGDLVVAVPDQWQALVRITRRFPADVIGISSAGPLDAVVASDLLGAGLAELVDVYGSSETSAIALRDLPATDYVLLPRWQLVPAANGDWQLADRTGTLVALPDHVERTGARTLRPIGRRDGAVQVGGRNVWPERVAAVLRTAPGVADAAVRVHIDGRLKAFIVPQAGCDPAALSSQLETFVGDRLSPPERPKRFRFGTSLPRNAMGKPEDWG